MNKIINDISTLTTISQHALYNLNDKVMACICHDVYESLLEGNSITEVDIGFGVLYIKCEESEIKYKFIPNKKLEENVALTIKNRVSPIVLEAETSLKERIENAYKNLL